MAFASSGDSLTLTASVAFGVVMELPLLDPWGRALRRRAPALYGAASIRLHGDRRQPGSRGGGPPAVMGHHRRPGSRTQPGGNAPELQTVESTHRGRP